MTITEKILAKAAGLDAVKPGQFIDAALDFVFANDVTAPVAIKEFEATEAEKVFDRERIAMIPDHFTPHKDIQSAQQVKMMKEFVKEKGIAHYFEIGRMGIEHALLPEEGLVLPGDTIIGADSHTCTYGALGAFSTGVGSTDLAAAMATGKVWLKVPASMKFVFNGKMKPWVSGKDLILYTIGKVGVDGALYKAMEFAGETIDDLSMDGRFTMCNMAIEAGAKNGIIAPDVKTISYVETRAKRPYEIFNSDSDANYDEVYEFDSGQVDLQVAFPHLPSNARGIAEVGNIEIDQVVIGSCTNGRIEDLRVAAAILDGREVHRRVRLLVIPATQSIYGQALEEGLLRIFLDAGAAISTPTCGPCLGGHMGVLASGERVVATTNRNFVGRMGHPESEVYLAGPAVAASSAIAGKIAGPDHVGADLPEGGPLP